MSSFYILYINLYLFRGILPFQFLMVFHIFYFFLVMAFSTFPETYPLCLGFYLDVIFSVSYCNSRTLGILLLKIMFSLLCFSALFCFMEHNLTHCIIHLSFRFFIACLPLQQNLSLIRAGIYFYSFYVLYP